MMKHLQKLGKAMMLPVAALPICGILMGLGYALAPAVICVGCLSAFRGYAQGHMNMTPTSVSQIIEALCKLFLGLALATWIVKQDLPDALDQFRNPATVYLLEQVGLLGGEDEEEDEECEEYEEECAYEE